MDKERSIIVGVGSISLSTTDGENHTMIAGGEEIILSRMELDNLHDALHAYMVAQ